jgi:hypothetical protein
LRKLSHVPTGIALWKQGALARTHVVEQFVS